jgi:hypothetical protein
MLTKLFVMKLANCCQSMEASELAWLLIQSIQMLLPDDTDEAEEFVGGKNGELEVLMAYLWLIASGLAKPVHIDNVGDASDALDKYFCKVRNTLFDAGGADAGGAGNETGGASGNRGINVTVDTTMLNATQQALMTPVNTMPSTLLAANAEKGERKSFLNGMSLVNWELFRRLCTQHIRHNAPVMSKFLKSLLAEKNTGHIDNHLHSVTKKWKVTFIEGRFCRFLPKGYISQREGTIVPGGFTIFIFIPKECEKPRDGFKESVEMLREMWGKDIGDNTLMRLTKMDIFLSDLKCLTRQDSTTMLNNWQSTTLTYPISSKPTKAPLSTMVQHSDQLCNWSHCSEPIQILKPLRAILKEGCPTS